ncbi:MAG TPA: hypothetical protein VGP00_07075 [Nocardioides sp.]|nr:hypothetical protein [Nocardioides sp.]
MPAPPAPRTAVATRRAALGGALASLAAVSACDVARPAGRPGDAAPGAPFGDGATRGGDPDTALLARVLAELGEVSGLVAAASRLAPLRAPMRALGELHAAHLAALAGRPATGASPAPAFEGPGEALGRVRAREQQAQRRLAAWSVAAESGALARLLASMSAGVAQHLAQLPAVLPAGAGADR